MLTKEAKENFVKYCEAEEKFDKINMMRYLKHIISDFEMNKDSMLFIEYLTDLQNWYYENFV